MRRDVSRWAGPVLGAAVFLAVLAFGMAISADWVKGNTEMRALVAQIEVSETAMTKVQDAERAALDAYQSSAAPSEADRARLHDALTAAATTGAAEVARAGDLIASVQTLPWHQGIKSAQAAYLAHNRAWEAYLTAAAKDPNEFGKTQTDVNDTWSAAEPRLRAAIPSPDLFGLQSRIDAIFAPPPADASNSQQA